MKAHTSNTEIAQLYNMIKKQSLFIIILLFILPAIHVIIYLCTMSCKKHYLNTYSYNLHAVGVRSDVLGGVYLW